MSDVVEELREYAVGSSLPVERELIEKAVDEIETLRLAMHDIYEVYAGIDGYLFDESKAYREQIVIEMSKIAAEHKR